MLEQYFLCLRLCVYSCIAGLFKEKLIISAYIINKSGQTFSVESPENINSTIFVTPVSLYDIIELCKGTRALDLGEFAVE